MSLIQKAYVREAYVRLYFRAYDSWYASQTFQENYSIQMFNKLSNSLIKVHLYCYTRKLLIGDIELSPRPISCLCIPHLNHKRYIWVSTKGAIRLMYCTEYFILVQMLVWADPEYKHSWVAWKSICIFSLRWKAAS